MQEFENSPEVLVIKDALREFFLGIIDNVKGAFRGFGEWMKTVKVSPPPLLKFFGNDAVNGTILIIFLGYIVFINIKAYFLFKKDKRYAQEGEERIPEWRLMSHIWIGGAIGSVIAMYRLRHKTRHRSFTISAWVCMVLYLLLFSVGFGFLSFWTFL